jgi:uncharacterized protein (DUF1697 family)
MAIQIAFLRGINVGGRSTLAMADLRGLFTELGFASPRTVLQTGNVLFDTDAAIGEDLERLLAAETARRLGLRTAYFVRTAAEWEGVIAHNPFPDEARHDPARLVVMPLKTAPTAAAIASLRDAIVGPERVEAVGAQLYLVYPEGIGRSKLTIKVIESKLDTQGTARNWNTVLKIAVAARS